MMKKFAFIAFIALVLASCTDEKYYTNVNTFTETYTVSKDHWKLDYDDSGAYFYYQFKEPAITYEVFEHGILNGYLYYTLNGVETISPLPFSDFWDEKEDKWIEQVTCEFSPGYVTFILKFDDHAEVPPQYDNKFMVKLMW